MPKRKEKVREFFQLFSGADEVLVVISADPDAIGSALAVKRLLWRRVNEVTISNVNPVDRPDNLAAIRLLQVPLVPFEKIDPAAFDKVVIVDSQPGHHAAMSGLKPVAVIDHHPDTQPRAPFVDIRSRYGATATILTEYLRAARIVPSTRLATALYHAIKTDTDNFRRQTLIEDIEAFQYLFRHANVALSRKIEQAELRLEYLKYFKIALKHLRLRKGRLFVHLGTVPNADICVVIADFFMRIHTVTWTIVSAVCDKRLVIIFRNDGNRKNAGRVAKEAFGGLGSAGGHKSMARAEISLAELKEPPFDWKEIRRVNAWIIERTERRAGPAGAAGRPEGRPGRPAPAEAHGA